MKKRRFEEANGTARFQTQEFLIPKTTKSGCLWACSGRMINLQPPLLIDRKIEGENYGREREHMARMMD